MQNFDVVMTLSNNQILDALLFDEIQHLLNHSLNVSDENEMKSLPPFISMWSAACNISLFFKMWVVYDLRHYKNASWHQMARNS